jgi:translation initiation factor 1
LQKRIFYFSVEKLRTMPKPKNSNSGIVYSTDPGFKPDSREETQEETLEPAQQNLRLRLDTRHRSGKAVTLVEYFTGTNDDLEKLGKQLKAYCGTGGSVKDRQIIIQGDQREKIFQWLIKNGYKKTKK